MKKTKLMHAAVAVLLALCLALPLGFAAFADETSYTITVTNAQENETYSAYKIFDVTTNESGGYSYTISADSTFYSAVSNFAEGESAGLTLNEAAAGGVYVVTMTDGFSAAVFAAAMKDAIGETSADATVKLEEGSEDSSLTLDVTTSGAGYYLITCDGEEHALAELTTTDNTVTITDKNIGPTIDKQQKDDTDGEYSDDNLSVQIGDTVYYQITGEVPSTTGYDSYTYEITDTLSEGLTLNLTEDSTPDVTITVGGTQVYPATEGKSAWTVKTVADDDDNITGFKASVDMASAGYEAGQKIVITYSAVVNENAVGGVYENKVELEYSNDPKNDSTGTYEDKTEVYNATIAVYKTDDGEDPQPLSGASFVLKNSEDKYYYYDEDSNTVEWKDDVSDATVLTTGEDGKFEKDFVGLEDGEYELIETEAPAGYNLLTESVKVTINGAANTEDGDDDNTEAVYVYNTTVQNSSGAELPETGGMGTTALYIAGAALVACAGVLLIVRFRMRKKNETD